MDVNSDQFQLKKILVDLEDEHQHLQVSIDHLKQEIEKREIEIKKLLAERELQLARENSRHYHMRKSFSADFRKVVEEQPPIEEQPNFSSELIKQISHLLNNINKTSEEVSMLIRL